MQFSARACALLLAPPPPSSSYNIVVRSAQSTVTLLPGIPMRDTLVHNAFDYYKFTVDQTVAFSLVLTPQSGDPDMYVAWSNSSTFRPSSANAIWASTNVGLDVITIHPDDPRAAPCYAGNSFCNYYIGVTSYTLNASYSLVAYLEDSDPVTLVDGQPQTGQVPQGITQQYVFFAAPGFSTLVVTVTPVIGDPDLYIGINATGAVDVHNMQYSSSSFDGPEVITIRSTDYAVGLNCDAGQTCPIKIGVTGYTNATFTIEVTMETYTQLQDGVALFDVVGANQYDLFVFYNDNPNANLSFSVTPYSGDPDMFITTVANSTNPPSTSNWYWRSTGLGREVVQIYSNDPHPCGTPCAYYIAVYGYNSNASFSILAEIIENTTIRLTDNDPVVYSIDQGETQQYELLVRPGTPTIEVGPCVRCVLGCSCVLCGVKAVCNTNHA